VKILIPAISQHRIHRCLLSLRTKPKDLIVVDNSVDGLTLPYRPGTLIRAGRNLGVARSWNIGVRAVMDDLEEDFLVICSQSVVFGRTGGRDIPTSLSHADEWGCEYAGMGWHMNAFSRKFLETFGFFDETFYPAYMEDTDALYRMGLLGIPSPRENGQTRPYFNIDASCDTDGGALKDGVAQVSFHDLQIYYEAKWGGSQGNETFKQPFNHPAADINWWPGIRQAGTY
jgi:hypothetical protein